MKGYKYLRILSITITKSNYCFLFVLSLGVTILVSVLLVARNNVNAQTLESISQQEKSLGNIPQIIVGEDPRDIEINKDTNKIYVANAGFNTVSVIDSDSGNTKTLRVGFRPYLIAIDEEVNKIYVLNQVLSL